MMYESDDYDYQYDVFEYYDEEEARQARRRRIILTIIALMLVTILVAYTALPLIDALQNAASAPEPIRLPAPQPRI